MPPLLLASVLYLGSGIGLAGWLAVRRILRGRPSVPPLGGADFVWLGAAIGAGETG